MTFTRRLISGAFQLTLSSGMVRLLSIVTMPILTVLLSPQAYGVAALVGTAISLVSVLALAGIEMSYARAYHSARPPNGAEVEQFCWRFAVSAALLMAVLGGVAWWLINRDSAVLDPILAILVALGIVFSVAHTMAHTRARLASRYTAAARTIVATGVIVAATSIGIAVGWRQDALALLLPLLLGYLIPILLLGTPPIAWLVKPSRLTAGEHAGLVKIGLASIATSPMYWLLSSSDRWFLQSYHGAEAVGVYSIGYSVAIVGMVVNAGVMSVWLPETMREYERDRKGAQVTLGRLMPRLIAAMALVWLVVAAAGGDIVRWLANERFHAAANYVPYIAGGVFFHGVLQLANSGLLLQKRLRLGIWWWLAGGLLCVLLNLTLVPGLGGSGAAITQSVSFAFIALGMLVTSQAIFRVNLAWSRLAMVLFIVVVAGVFMIPPWHGSAPFSLLMKLPIGIAVTGIVSWLVAQDWCIKGVQQLRRRMVQ